MNQAETSVVYFVEGVGTHAIKIGHTTQLNERMRQLGAMSPMPLQIIGVAPGDRSVEASLHQRFRKRRQHGEWFVPDAAMRASIGRMIAWSEGAKAFSAAKTSNANPFPATDERRRSWLAGWMARRREEADGYTWDRWWRHQ